MDSFSARRRGLIGAAGALALGAGAPGRSLGATRNEVPRMKRVIPSTGAEVTAIGLGTWQAFDIAGDAAAMKEAGEALQRFVELGGELVDSSPMYGSAETVVGELCAALGLHPRLFIATKVWTRGRDAGIAQMQSSMKKLRTDLKGALDLMQVHNLVDTATHLTTLRAWKKEGRVRHLGVTHYHAGAHAELEAEIRKGGLDFLQVNYSLAEPEAERRLLDAARSAGTAVIVNRPFAEGAMFARVKGRALPAVANELGCRSWAQLFLKWILAHPAVTCVIPGTRNAQHVADNLGALNGALPDAAQRRRIREAFSG